MNSVTLLCLFVAMVRGAPTLSETDVRRALPAIHHEEIHDDFGQYALRYVTAEGITYEERGRLVPDPDGKDYVLIYEGEYSFIGDDGITYKTKYTTGLEGHKVDGDHLPKAPENEDVKEETETATAEEATTTELPTTAEVAPEPRKLTEFPLEQHDEQEPRHPTASA